VCAQKWWRRRCARGSGGDGVREAVVVLGCAGGAAGYVVRAAQLGWRRRAIGGGGGAGRWARGAVGFFIWKIFLCREPSGLTAHVCRKHQRWLSAKRPLPAQRCRVGCAESELLSAQAPQIPVVSPITLVFLVSDLVLRRDYIRESRRAPCGSKQLAGRGDRSGTGAGGGGSTFLVFYLFRPRSPPD
jgi:hypothetical protein